MGAATVVVAALRAGAPVSLLALPLRLQVFDDLLAHVLIGQPSEWLHLVVRNDLIRIRDELVQRVRVPRDSGVLHAVRIARVVRRAGLRANDAVQRRALTVIARFRRMTR